MVAFPALPTRTPDHLDSSVALSEPLSAPSFAETGVSYQARQGETNSEQGGGR